MVLFYPTSPVHVRDLRQVGDRLPRWLFLAVLNETLASIAPGIDALLAAAGINSVTADPGSAQLADLLPQDAAVLLLGAVFEPFALELMAWARITRRFSG